MCEGRRGAAIGDAIFQGSHGRTFLHFGAEGGGGGGEGGGARVVGSIFDCSQWQHPACLDHVIETRKPFHGIS